MTRDEALGILNIGENASKDAIEQAYRKLVRRYPPEFHPDRFRDIDDAYRFLTSFPAMLDSFLSRSEGSSLAEIIPPVPPFPEVEPGDAVKELRRLYFLGHLWKKVRV